MSGVSKNCLECQGCQKIGRFCKVHSGEECTSSKPGRKFQQDILDVLGPLSRLWKGLEDIKNVPDDTTVSVPVEDQIKFIEQTIFLLVQASNSILPTFANIKNFNKGTKKAKNILKEKAYLLKKGDHYLSGKTFRLHIVGTERSKKKKKIGGFF